MDEKKLDCKMIKKMAASPPSIDANMGNRGCSSGEGVLSLTFENGVLVDEKNTMAKQSQLAHG